MPRKKKTEENEPTKKAGKKTGPGKPKEAPEVKNTNPETRLDFDTAWTEAHEKNRPEFDEAWTEAHAEQKSRAHEEVLKMNVEFDRERAEAEQAKVKKREALDGVSFNRVRGVTCPRCKMNCGEIPGGSVTNTLPWEGGTRIRYHTCRRCGNRFKSIEDE